MPLTSDQIIDRKRLKKAISTWRGLALLLVFAVIAFASRDYFGTNIGKVVDRDYVARVTIEGIIADDKKRDELLASIRDDSHAKALIVKLDTPGGTALGGEELYLQLREIAEEKPVVAVMRTLCTSAGYMTALAADRIFARESSLTGSIGVIMESVEVSELAKKIGITPIVIKSGEFKDAPSMFRPINAREEAAVASVVTDAYEHFKELVAKRRPLTPEEVTEIADGRVFTGRQALELKLIDALGAEKEAIAWLEKEKNIPKNLDIHDIEPEPEYEHFLETLQKVGGFDLFAKEFLPLDGLVSIWHPQIN